MFKLLEPCPCEGVFAAIDAAFKLLVAQRIKQFIAIVTHFAWDWLVTKGELFASGESPCVVTVLDTARNLFALAIFGLFLAFLAESMGL